MIKFKFEDPSGFKYSVDIDENLDESKPNSEENSKEESSPQNFTFQAWLKECWRFLSLSGSEFRKQHGTDAYLFLKYMKFTTIFAAVGMVICTAVLLPIDYLNAPRLERFMDFAESTISSLHPKSGFRVFHAAMIYLYSIGALILVFFIYSFVSKKRRIFYSRYTVMINGLRKTSSLKRDQLLNKLKDHFKNQYGEENIAGVHIVYDLSKFSKLIDQKENLEKSLTKLKEEEKKTGKRPLQRSKWWYLKKDQDAIDYYEDQIKKQEEKINNLVTKDGVACTRVVFISFNNLAVATTCYKDYKSPTKLSERTFVDVDDKKCILKSSKAPEKDDIIWNNLGTNPYRRIFLIIIVRKLSMN